jgi:hypothetical protein
MCMVLCFGDVHIKIYSGSWGFVGVFVLSVSLSVCSRLSLAFSFGSLGLKRKTKLPRENFRGLMKIATLKLEICIEKLTKKAG